MALLAYYQIDVTGRNAVVIGRSSILGKPMAMMLLNANATVTICHSKTLGLKEHIGAANLVVASLGKMHFVKGSWIAAGSVVIDAGYHEQGRGDVDFDCGTDRFEAYTPVPGGVGPMTIVTLIASTVQAAEARGG